MATPMSKFSPKRTSSGPMSDLGPSHGSLKGRAGLAPLTTMMHTTTNSASMPGTQQSMQVSIGPRSPAPTKPLSGTESAVSGSTMVFGRAAAVKPFAPKPKRVSNITALTTGADSMLGLDSPTTPSAKIWGKHGQQADTESSFNDGDGGKGGDTESELSESSSPPATPPKDANIDINGVAARRSSQIVKGSVPFLGTKSVAANADNFHGKTDSTREMTQHEEVMALVVVDAFQTAGKDAGPSKVQQQQKQDKFQLKTSNYLRSMPERGPDLLALSGHGMVIPATKQDPLPRVTKRWDGEPEEAEEADVIDEKQLAKLGHAYGDMVAPRKAANVVYATDAQKPDALLGTIVAATEKRRTPSVSKARMTLAKSRHAARARLVPQTADVPPVAFGVTNHKRETNRPTSESFSAGIPVRKPDNVPTKRVAVPPPSNKQNLRRSISAPPAAMNDSPEAYDDEDRDEDEAAMQNNLDDTGTGDGHTPSHTPRPISREQVDRYKAEELDHQVSHLEGHASVSRDGTLHLSVDGPDSSPMRPTSRASMLSHTTEGSLPHWLTQQPGVGGQGHSLMKETANKTERGRALNASLPLPSYLDPALSKRMVTPGKIIVATAEPGFDRDAARRLRIPVDAATLRVKQDPYSRDISHALDKRRTRKDKSSSLGVELIAPIPGETVVAEDYVLDQTYPVPPNLKAEEQHFGDGSWQLHVTPNRNPVGRREVYHLAHWLETEWENTVDEQTEDLSDNSEKLQMLLTMAFQGLCRQLYVDCTERGRVAELLWTRHQAVTDSVIARMRELETTLATVQDSYKTLTSELKEHYEGAIAKLHEFYGNDLGRMQRSEVAFKAHIASLKDRLALTKKVAEERSKDALNLKLQELQIKTNKLAKRTVVLRDLLNDSCEDWEQREMNKERRKMAFQKGFKEVVDDVLKSVGKNSQLGWERHMSSFHQDKKLSAAQVARLERDEQALRAGTKMQNKELIEQKKSMVALQQELEDEKERRRKMIKEKKDQDMQTDPVYFGGKPPPEEKKEEKKDEAPKEIKVKKPKPNTPAKFQGWKSGLGLLISMKNIKKDTNKTIQYKLFLKQVDEIYKLKTNADAVDDREDNPRQSLPEFVYDYYTNKYGLRALADQNVFGLMQTINMYKTRSFKVELFGKFLGFYEPLPLADLNLYLEALNLMKVASTGKPIEEVCPTGQTNSAAEKDTNIVSLLRTTTILPKVFFPISPDAVQEIAANIEADIPSVMIKREPVGSDNSPDYDLEQILFKIIEEKKRMENAKRQALLDLFADADEDGDGVLTVEEFREFAQGINGSLTDDTCDAMHSEMLELSNSESILPEVFVTVALKYRLIKDAEGTQLDIDISDKLARLAQQKNSMQAAYDEFDRKGSKELTMDDFMTGFERMGMQITAMQCSVIFSRIDTDGDGKLTRDEFLSLVLPDAIDFALLDALKVKGNTPQQWYRQIDESSMFKPVSRAQWVKKLEDVKDNILTKTQVGEVFDRILKTAGKKPGEELPFTDFLPISQEIEKKSKKVDQQAAPTTPTPGKPKLSVGMAAKALGMAAKLRK